MLLWFILLFIGNKNNFISISYYSLINVMTEYLKDLQEESVRDNFVVIYELLDEMIDNGFPQNTEIKILSDLIKSERH